MTALFRHRGFLIAVLAGLMLAALTLAQLQTGIFRAQTGGGNFSGYEGSNFTLTCGGGLSVHIISCNYGKPSMGCPYVSCASALQQACNQQGGSTCNQSFNNYLPYDPCVGTFKEGNLSYDCQNPSIPAVSSSSSSSSYSTGGGGACGDPIYCASGMPICCGTQWQCSLSGQCAASSSSNSSAQNGTSSAASGCFADPPYCAPPTQIKCCGTLWQCTTNGQCGGSSASSGASQQSQASNNSQNSVNSANSSSSKASTNSSSSKASVTSQGSAGSNASDSNVYCCLPGYDSCAGVVVHNSSETTAAQLQCTNGNWPGATGPGTVYPDSPSCLACALGSNSSRSSASANSSAQSCDTIADCSTATPTCGSCQTGLVMGQSSAPSCSKICNQTRPTCVSHRCIAAPYQFLQQCSPSECTASSSNSQTGLRCVTALECPLPPGACSICKIQSDGSCAASCPNWKASCTNGFCAFENQGQNNLLCEPGQCGTTTGSQSSASQSAASQQSAASCAAVSNDGSPVPVRMRITYTRIGATDSSWNIKPEIRINGPTKQHPERPLIVVQSGEWFDISDVFGYDGHSEEERTYLSNVSPAIGAIDGMVHFNFQPQDGRTDPSKYAEYYGTIEFEGAKPTLAQCNPNDTYLWYCPENERDGLYSEPDNDEIAIQDNVVRFYIHTKNVINGDGSIDTFNVHYKSDADPRDPRMIGSIYNPFYPSQSGLPPASCIPFTQGGLVGLQVDYTRADYTNTSGMQSSVPANVYQAVSDTVTAQIPHASGEWFSVYLPDTNNGNGEVFGPIVTAPVSPGPLPAGATKALQFTFNPLLKSGQNVSYDGSYYTYKGVIKMRGATIIDAYCNRSTTQTYCPEREHDGTESDPDDDEIYVQDGVAYFSIHIKNTTISQGRFDRFMVYYKPLPICAADASSTASLPPCSVASASSASAGSKASSSQQGSNGSQNSGGSAGSDGSNGSAASSGSNGSAASNVSDASNGSYGSIASNGFDGSQASSFASVAVLGGVCTGRECAEEGGDEFCQMLSQVCTPTNNLPCLRCDDINVAASSASATPSNSSHAQSHASEDDGRPQSAGSVASRQSSAPIVIAQTCTGTECIFVGDSFCGAQSKVCELTSDELCFRCVDENTSSAMSLASSAASQRVSTASQGSAATSHGSVPATALAFLGETCTLNNQCVTNLCRNNLCTPCTQASDCSSGLCRNGACLIASLANKQECSDDSQCLSGFCFQNTCVATTTLPAQSNEAPVAFADPDKDGVADMPLYRAATAEVLPAQIIELPFGDVDQPADGRTHTAKTQTIVKADGTIITTATHAGATASVSSNVPSTPSTGPAALAVMLAGGAAGWLYRRRK